MKLELTRFLLCSLTHHSCPHFVCRQTIFLMLSIAAVLTNAGLITFTMDVLDPLSTTNKFWVFIGFQWVCFSLQVGAALHVHRLCSAVLVMLVSHDAACCGYHTVSSVHCCYFE